MLRELRPAPGLMGAVKTIQVGAERWCLNYSLSYLSSDASTWKIHFSEHCKGNFKAPSAHLGQLMGLGQIEGILGKNKHEKDLID